MLEKFGVEMIGAKAEAIDMAEDRQLFRESAWTPVDRLLGHDRNIEAACAHRPRDGGA